MTSKKEHVDIVDTSDACPRGLWSSVRQISNNTNGKTENQQYDNTNDIFLDIWRGVLLAAPGMAHLVGSSSSGYGCVVDVSQLLIVYLVTEDIVEIAKDRGGI
jgi:hypothetical protein